MGKDCGNPATDKPKNCCIADPYAALFRSEPLIQDTDGGGKSDGSEDPNRNGRLDAGETDPTSGHGADDGSVVDTDGDGLGDLLEMELGSDPNDADSDDDGTKDGLEPNPSQDVDGDGKIDVLDPDIDGDGIFDGTEMGFPCVNPPTNPSKNSCIPDADMGMTTTSPLNPDTDYGGVKDGVEDANHNGVVDAGETDPNDPGDDLPCMMDSDCPNGQICDTTNGVCRDGCSKDSDCGGPMSGKV